MASWDNEEDEDQGMTGPGPTMEQPTLPELGKGITSPQAPVADQDSRRAQLLDSLRAKIGPQADEQRAKLVEEAEKNKKSIGLAIAEGLAQFGSGIAHRQAPTGVFDRIRSGFDDPVRQFDQSQSKALQDFQTNNTLDAAQKQQAMSAEESDPQSPKSQLAQSLAKKLLPSSGGKFDNMSAAQINSLLPSLQGVYKVEQEKLARVDERNFRREMAQGEQASRAAIAAANKEATVKPAQRALDTAFAKEYNDNFASGQFADAVSNLDKLRMAKKNLDTDTSLTGPVVGHIPDTIRAQTNPKALATQEAVAEVIQRSLRPILGAQFTEKEGERLIARAYNPNLSTKENSKRVGRLLSSLEETAQQKLAAAKYFEENGTLAGYKGTKSKSVDDLMAHIDSESGPAPESGVAFAGTAASPSMPKAGAVEDGHRFKGGDPADPNNWEVVSQ